jgi:DNA-binding MarR family transcriptional regulator
MQSFTPMRHPLKRDAEPAAESPPATPAAPLSEEIYRLIGRSRRLLWMASARSLEARGESVFTWQVICYLTTHGPTVQQDLAMATAQDPAGLSRVLDDLEARKLVRRGPHPDDRRRLVVEATKRGATWYRTAAPTVLAAVDEAMAALDAKQRKALRDLLRALLQLPPAAAPQRAKK